MLGGGVRLDCPRQGKIRELPAGLGPGMLKWSGRVRLVRFSKIALASTAEMLKMLLIPQRMFFLYSVIFSRTFDNFLHKF